MARTRLDARGPGEEATGAQIGKAGSRNSAVVCFYGVPGCGKTTLVGSDPAVKTLIIRPYSGSIPAAVAGVADELVVSHYADMVEGLRELQQGLAKEYDWVWLDDAALLQDVLMDDAFADAIARNATRAAFGWDKQEYGLQQSRFSKFCRDMVAIANAGDTNFGIVAHAMEWYDPVQEEMKWAPHIEGGQGKFMNRILGMTQVVAFYGEAESKGKIHRVLRTQAYGDLAIVTKDQLDLGGEKHRLVDPSMAAIHKAIGTRKRTTTKRRATTRRRRNK